MEINEVDETDIAEVDGTEINDFDRLSNCLPTPQVGEIDEVDGNR